MTDKLSGSGEAASSPCVRNCCLNEDDICLGCFRSVEEICAWSSLSNDQRLKVIELATKRKVTKN